MSSRAVVLLCLSVLVLAGCKSNEHRIGSRLLKSPPQNNSWASTVYAANGRALTNRPGRPLTRRRHFKTDYPDPVNRARYYRGPNAYPVYGDTNRAYTLDTGDVVRIDVFEQSNLSRLYRVDGGGFISMPLVGSIAARGMTTDALEQEVAARLRRSYLKDPKVNAEVSTYRPFYILGEVRNSGQYPYVIGMTVETAVAIAGGYSPRANQRKVEVIRRLDDRMVRTQVPVNYQLRPGDTIKVIERLF